jgi:hypothetical protein
MDHKDDVLKEFLTQLELHLHNRLKHGGFLLLSENQFMSVSLYNICILLKMKICPQFLLHRLKVCLKD